ncbi:hypothetical protein TNCV_2945291 [Trichonephila clavipes]|nr:hypothetical protein TNCV_2945291 [Trichonephila clavipes]
MAFAEDCKDCHFGSEKIVHVKRNLFVAAVAYRGYGHELVVGESRVQVLVPLKTNHVLPLVWYGSLKRGLSTQVSLSLSHFTSPRFKITRSVTNSFKVLRWTVGGLVVRALDSRPEGLGLMLVPQISSEYTRSKCSLNQWVRKSCGLNHECRVLKNISLPFSSMPKLRMWR